MPQDKTQPNPYLLPGEPDPLENLYFPINRDAATWMNAFADMSKERDAWREHDKQMRDALEWYANPVSINASQHANGSINIWEGGGNDTLGTCARKALALKMPGEETT